MIVWIVEEHFSKVFKNIFEKCDKKGEMDKPGLSLRCTTVEINRSCDYPCDAPSAIALLAWLQLLMVKKFSIWIIQDGESFIST